MIQRPAPLPTELGEQFSYAAAVARGVSPSRLRGSDLDAPFRGARRVRGLESDAIERSRLGPDIRTSPGHASRTHVNDRLRAEHRDLARSYYTVAPSGTFFTGRTAAVLFGLPVTLRPGQPLEVARLHPLRAPRGVRVHGMQIRSRLVNVGVLEGLPVSCPETTWAMLARALDWEQLVVLGDAIVFRDARRSRRPLGSVEGLRAASLQRGRPGGSLLREAVPHVRVGSASPPETLLRLALVRAGLPEPALDVVVRDARGRALGRSELAYLEQRVALEYESDHHRVDRKQWNRDITKYQEYAEAGWRVLRVTSHLLFRARGELIRQVNRALGSSL